MKTLRNSRQQQAGQMWKPRQNGAEGAPNGVGQLKQMGYDERLKSDAASFQGGLTQNKFN